MLMPKPPASFPSTAAVGEAAPRSMFESIERLTLVAPAASRRFHPRPARKCRTRAAKDCVFPFKTFSSSTIAR